MALRGSEGRRGEERESEGDRGKEEGKRGKERGEEVRGSEG